MTAVSADGFVVTIGVSTTSGAVEVLVQTTTHEAAQAFASEIADHLHWQQLPCGHPSLYIPPDGTVVKASKEAMFVMLEGYRHMLSRPMSLLVSAMDTMVGAEDSHRVRIVELRRSHLKRIPLGGVVESAQAPLFPPDGALVTCKADKKRVYVVAHGVLCPVSSGFMQKKSNLRGRVSMSVDEAVLDSGVFLYGEPLVEDEHFVEFSIWAISTGGAVFARTGVSLDNPTGSEWVEVDTPEPVADLAVGAADTVWMATARGSAYIRSGEYVLLL